METVGLLLANGRSVRFGEHNKLLAAFNGQPLITHPANALRSFKPDHLIAVTDSLSVAAVLGGFEILRPPSSRSGQGDGVSLSVERALNIGAERVLIVLGDMPPIDV